MTKKRDTAKSGEKDVQSVRRAFDILEAVSAVGELGVTEIAQAVGLHVATVHNLLRTLSRYHYLENRGGRYRLGVALSMLTAENALAGLPELLQPRLERISKETGEAASASVLNGEVLRIVAFQPGTHALTIHYPQWVWPQPLELATGRLLVAELPEEEWAAFIPHGKPHEEEAWRKTLQTIRENGCSVTAHTSPDGQAAIALPVRARTGKILAAIGASAPVFRATPDLCGKMFATIRDVALELSNEFGCPKEHLKAIKATAMPDWETILAGK